MPTNNKETVMKYKLIFYGLYADAQVDGFEFEGWQRRYNIPYLTLDGHVDLQSL
jgi:hypothetical protein